MLTTLYPKDLHNLFESVLEKHRNETQQLVKTCEILKALPENKIRSKYCTIHKYVSAKAMLKTMLIFVL